MKQTIKTVYCKGCKKLEVTERPINYLNCSEVIIDGVKYPALFLHASATEQPIDYNGIRAIRMWNMGGEY